MLGNVVGMLDNCCTRSCCLDMLSMSIEVDSNSVEGSTVEGCNLITVGFFVILTEILLIFLCISMGLSILVSNSKELP